MFFVTSVPSHNPKLKLKPNCNNSDTYVWTLSSAFIVTLFLIWRICAGLEHWGLTELRMWIFDVSHCCEWWRQGILLVYDVTNPTSFDNLDEWVHVISKVFATTKKPHLALIGNKGLSLSTELHTATDLADLPTWTLSIIQQLIYQTYPREHWASSSNWSTRFTHVNTEHHTQLI